MKAVSGSAIPSLVFLLSISLAACGGAPAALATPRAAEPAVFELGEMTMFSGNDAGVRFHAGGTVEVRDVDRDPQGRRREVWNAGPTIKADGSIEFQGQLLARIHGDGTITDKAGKPLPLTIQGDRLAFTDRTGAGIELTADGTLTPTWPRSGPVLRVEGADTPGKRRTVLAVVWLYAPGPPDVEAGAPQETTAPPR